MESGFPLTQDLDLRHLEKRSQIFPSSAGLYSGKIKNRKTQDVPHTKKRFDFSIFSAAVSDYGSNGEIVSFLTEVHSHGFFSAGMLQEYPAL